MVLPITTRGPLKERKADLQHSRYADDADDEASQYEGSAYNRRHGQFRSISTNPQDLQRRFDRHYDKLTRLTADNEAVRAKLEETTESHAEALTMIERLKGLVDQMTEKCEHLQADQQAILEEMAEEKCDVSFKDENSGSFDQDFELVVMQVLHMSSYRKAVPLIKVVYDNLTSNRLVENPSRGWLQKVFRRAGILCELQVAEALMDYFSRHPKAKLVGVHDGTSKRGMILSGFQFIMGERTYSLGIEEVSDGTAVTMYNSFMRRLEWSLETVASHTGGDSKSYLREVLLNISTSLSDRCPVEIKWNALLEKDRLDLIKGSHCPGVSVVVPAAHRGVAYSHRCAKCPVNVDNVSGPTLDLLQRLIRNAM